jgi:cytochrome c peroxidase
MAVNPKNGKVYVTNLDAHNEVRFEGHNAGVSTVRGRIADSMITVIDPQTGHVDPRDMNPHVDFTQEGNPAEKALSSAFPIGVTVSDDGQTLFAVAQGSSKLDIYKTSDVEAGNMMPVAANQVALSGGGPTGVVVDHEAERAYVLDRFDNSISIVDVEGRKETGKVTMYNPEPASVTAGRKYLYDATITSQHGTTACASCHIGGDKDELAWDLGNPGAIPLQITKLGANGDIMSIMTINPQAIIQLLPQFAGVFVAYMPLKGPMTTQSLRGLDNHGPLHWRGDRNGAVQQSGVPFIDPATGQPVVSAQPDSGIFNEQDAIKSFNVAFPGLNGNDAELSSSDIQDFANFALQITYPPNPNRNLDDSLTPEQQAGQAFYFNHVETPNGPVELPSDRFHNCNGCHTLDRNANAATSKHPGFFGTDGKLSFEFETQVFKVPHLRNLYTKIGMFGSSPDTLQPGTIVLQQGPATDQIRGFGFQHDGSLGQLEHFFTGQVFMQASANVTLLTGQVVPPNPYGIPFVDPNLLAQGQIALCGTPAATSCVGSPDDIGGFKARHAMVNYLLAFDSNMMPIVGQQTTMTSSNGASAGPRLDLLEQRATAGDCDLVAKTTSALGQDAGFLYGASGWQPASASAPAISDSDFRKLIAARLLPPVTFTCVPPGSGTRIAIDRDGDGFADYDELALGKNPADPNSHP